MKELLPPLTLPRLVALIFLFGQIRFRPAVAALCDWSKITEEIESTNTFIGPKNILAPEV
jgi:hypothetical protein